MKTVKPYIGIFLRGICMGAADLVPGVSGGTVAFITGIYQRLLAAISAFSSAALWRELLRFNISGTWQLADGKFLLALGAGILSAVVLFNRLLHYLLSEHTHLLLAFFCGLVLASAKLVARELHAPTARHWAIGIVGAVFTLMTITQLPAGSMTPTLPTLFIGGAVAICAMLLPGISGSYILLIAGLYGAVINAIHEREIIALLIFAIGCGCGLLLFSRLLSYLLHRWHDAIVSLLIGVMLGALPKLWPWKAHADGMKIILQPNVLPTVYESDPQIWAALALASLGAMLVLALQKTAATLIKDN
ncbi:DUF368 domain-containing protein [Candidatus Persebacteraceae bacterium Df01]|jgi:putative membrane protein|uniref:DUF368 domain-containing protein n=1 Tax=Candidatus Doriopsillibacter californiensis TaxID=2970740 RepID=A0ABT7QLZ3_9GAMM|nr:DUF368 domain-containing protein [Candidatus Persebacteraceae bacterium Df01]